MVYKRYIKRGGKLCGPYYYESYRDKNGKVKSRFVSGPTKKDELINKVNPKVNRHLGKSLHALFLVFIAFFIIALFFIIIIGLNRTIGYKASLIPDGIKGTGFSVLGTESVEQRFDTSSLDLAIKEPAQAFGEIVSKNKNKRMDFSVGEKNIRLYFDLLNYSEFVDNVAEEMVSSYAYENSEISRISGNVVEETKLADDSVEIKMDIEDIKEKADELAINNEAKINEIADNSVVKADSFEVIVNETNLKKPKPEYKWGYKIKLNDLKFMAKIDVTSDEKISVYNDNTLKIGRTLLSLADLTKAGYKVRIESPTLSIPIENLSVVVNQTIVNITSVNETELNITEVNETEVNVTLQNETIINETEINVTQINVTGPVVNVTVEESIENKTPEEQSSIEENQTSEEVAEGSDNYLTAQVIKFFKFTGKVISGITGRVIGGDVEYANSYTIYIEKEFPSSSSNENSTFASPSYEDLDGDGKISVGDIIDLDPTLIIEISKAEHLDADRNYIEDVYDSVKTKDDTWTSIPNNEFVRVAFEKALSKNNDITLFAKSSGNSQIEVYRKDDDRLLTKFDSITNSDWYRVYLNGLNEGESQSVFDLKILGNPVQINYIVDPTENPPNMSWNATGPAGTAMGVAIDNNSNVYVTGTSNTDCFTMKYNSTGSNIWNASWNGGGTETCRGVAVDNDSSVYVTGCGLLTGTYFTAKYNSSGSNLFNITSAGNECSNAITVDSLQNIYVAGSDGFNNYYTVKYNSTGGKVWNATYNSGGMDTAYGIAVDNSSNVYVTGGAATSHYYTIKYNSTGSQVWNASYSAGANANGYAIAVDDNFVYITGSINNGGADQSYYTIKYNSTNGSQIWVSVYKISATDYAYGIDVDNSGNVYVTGTANNGVADVYTTVKYNSTGSQVWNVTGPTGTAHGIDVDSQTNVYVTGVANANYFTIKYGNVTTLIDTIYPSFSNYYDNSFNWTGAGLAQFNTTVSNTNGTVFLQIDGKNYTASNLTSNVYNVSISLAVGIYNYTWIGFGNGTDKKQNTSGIRNYVVNPINTIWNATFDSSGGDWAYGIAVDSHQNVYVTGNAFMPGNYYTVKYNSTGGQTWNASYDSGGNDVAYGVAVDSSQNVYVTGTNVPPSINNNYYTIKYNSTGGQTWNASYDSGGEDYAYGITADNSGNVYVTGTSFDNFYTIKYNATNGSQIWSVSGPTGNAYGIAVDSSQNVYVTGSVDPVGPDPSDFYTIKYNSTGSQVWNASYDGFIDSADYAYGIAVDNKGFVYVTGQSDNTGGFSNDNYFTIKYNATNGSQIWNASYDYDSGTDGAYGIAVDNQSNVYVTGTVIIPSLGNFYSTVEYNSTGSLIWNYTDSYTGTAGFARGIAIDTYNYVYVTGYLLKSSNYDYYTAKYNNSLITSIDTIFPIFSNYVDNNGSLTGSGIAWFNTTVLNTSGTVFLQINNRNYTASNLAGNRYNVSISLAVGIYNYTWISWGNGPNNNINISNVRSYTVNPINYSWNATYDSGAIDTAKAIAVDSHQNVYVTGTKEPASNNAYTIKYNSTGGEVWNATFDNGGASYDAGYGIAVDNSGNVYIAGENASDYLILKYNSTGSPVWNISYNSLVTDKAYAIAVDNKGFVYTTGQFNEPTGNYYTMKSNATNGSQIWVVTGPFGTGYGIAVDNNSNVYVTGTNNSDYYTIKYNSTGGYVWNASYSSGGLGASTDMASGIAVDNNYNVYVTGKITPGAESLIHTIKYNSTGGQVWATTDSPGLAVSSFASGIALDSLKNVYVTGYSTLGGPDVNYYTIKYNSTNGDKLWNTSYNPGGGVPVYSYGIAVDAYDYVYVTGQSNSNYFTIKYSNSTNSDGNYPQFSNYSDNSGTLTTSGTAWFNATVTNTNGTVLLRINNTNYTATNLSANVYNVSVNFTASGTYYYNWTSWGNGTNHNYNVSAIRSYVVNAPAGDGGNTGGGGSSSSPAKKEETPQQPCTSASTTCSGWGECFANIQKRTCTDSCQNWEESKECEFYSIIDEIKQKGESVAVPETPSEQSSGISQPLTPGSFVSSILKGGETIWGEWGDCETTYNDIDIFNNNVLLKGVRKRVGVNSINPSKISYQYKDCYKRNPIIIKKNERCSKTYLEAYDENNNLVSRLELIEEISQNKKLNIDFVLDSSNYCDYCYDGIKDFDEDEVDCNFQEGKSCPVCNSFEKNEYKSNLNAKVIQDISSISGDNIFRFLIVLLVLLIIVFILLKKKKKRTN